MTTSQQRRAGGTTAALVAAAIVLGGCGSNDKTTDDKPEATATTPASTAPVLTTGTGAQPLLVRTRVTGFDGVVLAGSVLGESFFCPGAVVHHNQGSPDIGFPAVNVFRCKDGELRIGFGPGSDQMENQVQTSAWSILDGTGRYAGATGEGRMVVQWVGGEPPRGAETFVGLVLLR